MFPRWFRFTAPAGGITRMPGMGGRIETGAADIMAGAVGTIIHGVEGGG